MAPAPRAEEILQVLDACSERFDFPALDNAHWDLAAGRLRGFVRDTDWAITCELLVFSRPQVEFVTKAFGYGPLIGPEGFGLFELAAADSVPDTPLWDEEGNWIPETRLRSLRVGSAAVLQVACGEKGRGLIELEADECRDEVTFLRGLVRTVGMEGLTPKHAILDAVPGLAVASERFALMAWDHPDVSRGGRPSQSHALRAAAQLLAGAADAIEYDHARDNTDWARWTKT